MSRLTFLKLLLSPSLLSGMTVMCLTLAILIGSSILYVTENHLFYDYLFGTRGVATTLLRAPDSQSAIWGAITRGSFAYYALLAAASLVAGLAIWAILRGISKVAQEASFALDALQQARIAQREAIQEMFERLMIRVLGLIIGALYIILFVEVLLPLILLLLQYGLNALDAGAWLDGIWQIAGSTLLLTITLHLHIILARLCTLRLRILGGADVQLAAIED